MAIIYELWDIGSANLIDSFATEEAALAAVRSTIDCHGRRTVRLWALTMKDLEQNGQTATLARGASLAARASAEASR
jgi:hypothetical protein